MTLRDRIYLTWMDGGGQLVAGGIYNIGWALLLAFIPSPAMAISAFIVKVPFSALTFLLSRQLKPRDSCFFQINLGFSRWAFQATVALVDFLLLAVLVTTALLLNHGRA